MIRYLAAREKMQIEFLPLIFCPFFFSLGICQTESLVEHEHFPTSSDFIRAVIIIMGIRLPKAIGTESHQNIQL